VGVLFWGGFAAGFEAAGAFAEGGLAEGAFVTATTSDSDSVPDVSPPDELPLSELLVEDSVSPSASRSSSRTVAGERTLGLAGALPFETVTVGIGGRPIGNDEDAVVSGTANETAFGFGVGDDVEDPMTTSLSSASTIATSTFGFFPVEGGEATSLPTSTALLRGRRLRPDKNWVPTELFSRADSACSVARLNDRKAPGAWSSVNWTRSLKPPATRSEMIVRSRDRSDRDVLGSSSSGSLLPILTRRDNAWLVVVSRKRGSQREHDAAMFFCA
jgi:hypothetical protein